MKSYYQNLGKLFLAFSMFGVSTSHAETKHFFDTLEVEKKYPLENFHEALDSDCKGCINPQIVRISKVPTPTDTDGKIAYRKVTDLVYPGVDCKFMYHKKDESLQKGQVFQIKPAGYKIKIRNGQRIMYAMLNLIELQEFENNGRKDYKEKVEGVNFAYACDISEEGWNNMSGSYKWIAPLTWRYVMAAEHIPEKYGSGQKFEVVPQSHD